MCVCVCVCARTHECVVMHLSVQVPAVRAEACHTLCQLWQRKRQQRGEGEDMRGGQMSAGGGEEESRVISTLRDRLVVEDDATVTRELTSVLSELGVSAEREDPLLASIRSEVQRLGTGDAITQGVLDNDLTAMTDYVIARPLAHPSTRDYLTPQHR